MTFDTRWETAVYGAGRQLNRYPYDVVVTTICAAFGAVADRSAVRVLELGCGAGNNLWFLAREGFTAAGIDGSATAIEHARGRLHDERLEADLRTGDFTSLPWPDRSFDAVVDRCAVTHNRRADIERALGETQRVLGPGGLLFAQLFSDADSGLRSGRALGDGSYDDFDGGYFSDIALTFFASRRDVEELFGGFDVESIEHHVVTSHTTGLVSATWNLRARRPDDG